MSRRPRIALVMPAKTLGWGGVQRFADCLHTAAREIWDVEPVWFHPDAGVARTPRAWSASLASGLRRLYSLHRRARLDAVVSTFHAPFRLLLGVPMMGFVHDLRSFDLHGSGTSRGGRDHLRKWALAATFRSWDGALVPSSHVAADMRRMVPRLQVTTVGEGLDHLDVEGAAIPDSPRDVVLAIAGRAPHKRGELGLEVLERVVERVGCRGIVLGKVSRAPRDSRIEVHESSSDAEMVCFYKRARAAIAPTSYEGFGLAAGEAMRFGVPVVFGNDCPLHELVGRGGVGVAPTASAMARALEEVLANQAGFSQAARETAAPYTWRRTVERIDAALGLPKSR